MRFDIVTIFPGFFESVFAHGIVRRAIKEGLVTVEAHDLREFAHDRHRTVDDRPFGGGEGMVLKPEPLAEALGALGVKRRDQGTEGTRDQESRDQRAEIRDQEEREHGDEGTREPDRSADGETAQKRKAGPSTPVAAATSAQDDRANVRNAGPRSTSNANAFFAQGRLSTPVAAATSAQDDKANPQDDNSAGETRVILLSAQGRLFTQAVARELAAVERVVLVCGRYEGVDERVSELYCDMELSVGDYVLSGGELAAAIVVDATMRLIPGVLGNEASGEFESFGAADGEIDVDVRGVPRSQHGAGGLLDYPQYTRPAEFGGLRAPEVLMNGDHAEIRRWRREQQLRKTLKNRPELLERATLSAEDRRLLAEMSAGKE